MLSIEYKDNLSKELKEKIDQEFSKYALDNSLESNYKSFNFIAKEDDKIVGIITGHCCYKEIHISDLIITKNYRHKRLGTKLINTVETYYKNKDFENINVTTYQFQAPVFYEKCGFKIEFVRENKENPKLNKYYLVKYFK